MEVQVLRTGSPGAYNWLRDWQAMILIAWFFVNKVGTKLQVKETSN